MQQNEVTCAPKVTRPVVLTALHGGRLGCTGPAYTILPAHFQPQCQHSAPASGLSACADRLSAVPQDTPPSPCTPVSPASSPGEPGPTVFASCLPGTPIKYLGVGLARIIPSASLSPLIFHLQDFLGSSLGNVLDLRIFRARLLVCFAVL